MCVTLQAVSEVVIIMRVTKTKQRWYYNCLNNSLIIDEENTKKITTFSVVLNVIKFQVIFVSIGFEFLGLDNINFENYFGN